MRQAEEFFAGLYGGAMQPIAVYTAAGEPLYCNRAANLLLERWGLGPQALFEKLGEDAALCLQEQSGRGISLAPRQEAIDLYLYPYPYEGQAYLIVQAEEAAGGVQRDLLRVLRNSGAKMNSYLNGIYGTAQKLGLETEAGERLGRDVHRLLRMKNHLYQLLDRSGTMDYLVPMEIAPFVQNYARSVMELKPQVRLRVAEIPEGLFVRMMPEDMELVLSVLVSNACRFGNGEIMLAAEKKGARIGLSVLDNGAGPKEPSRLFEWGYRTSDASGVRGLGFSLAMAKQLLENQGGSLEYSRVGEQTCFTVWLEISDLPQGSVLAEWSAEPLSNSLSQLRIELSDIL